MALRLGRGVERDDHLLDVVVLLTQPAQIEFHDVEVVFGFDAQALLELMSLMAVVGCFNRLLQTDGDEQTDADGGDVDEEVLPGVGGFVGRVDVEHGVSPAGVCSGYASCAEATKSGFLTR